MCIKTERLKFVDISNYLAPGYSYDQFLKAYECTAQKGFFPYEWFDDVAKLDYETLPAHDDFFSALRNKNISADEYSYCCSVWQNEEMVTFKDYLVWYNNRDVEPFVEAIEKMFEFYRPRNLDLFKDGISVPGLVMKYLFSGLDQNTFFSLFQEKDKDLYYKFKENIVGGPSIIFHRYQEKKKTRIRGGKSCKRIWGADANALYLWALSQPMPTGYYARRRKENNFKKEDYFNKISIEWLDYVAYRDEVDIKHAHNHGEQRIGCYLVDGFDSNNNTIYEFNGCYFHGHKCELNTHDFNKKCQVPMSELYRRTIERQQYLESRGFKVVCIWECEYKNMRKTDENLKDFRFSYKQEPNCRSGMPVEQIISSIRSDTLFGVVRCDIRVPDDKKEKFSEMCPVFKNVDTPFACIGEHMQQFVNDNKLTKNPKRGLIGSMFGDNILLITPLLKWYLDHGLVVTEIYEVIEYTPNRCFQTFADNVSNARRAGDIDPSKAIIAETSKLFGNAGYGGTLTNKETHLNISYCDESAVGMVVNDPHFRKLDVLDDNFYEISMTKTSIKLNLPMQIGFFVYQYAKLHMLSFYYDFMDKFLDRADFEYCEMDTDSAYVALSGDNIEALVRSELKNLTRKFKNFTRKI